MVLCVGYAVFEERVVVEIEWLVIAAVPLLCIDISGSEEVHLDETLIVPKSNTVSYWQGLRWTTS